MQTPFSVKNLIVFRLSRDVDFSKLEEQTAHFKFSPCGSQDMAKADGFLLWVMSMIILLIKRQELFCFALKPKRKISRHLSSKKT